MTREAMPPPTPSDWLRGRSMAGCSGSRPRWPSRYEATSSQQYSVPGGRLDPGDASLLNTALREAEEEVGLDPSDVTVLGALAPTPTIATGYAIYPFVAAIANDLTWQSSPAEVAELIELPLKAVCDGYGRRRLVRRSLPIRTDTYVVGDHLIWGATARILGDLFDRIEL
jgi:8-oxo-dGTP pyrophosphatase MutT (NUDIX family)